MADVLRYPGTGASGGVPAPYLQGHIFPARDRLGGRIAIGMGQMTRRFADVLDTEGGVAINEAQLQALLTAVAQGAASQQVTNYNFAGLIGPPGPPGQGIVKYLPPIPGIGQGGWPGSDGDDARVVHVSADGYIFVTAKDGTTSPASIILTATTQGIDSPTYQWQYWDGAAWQNVAGATLATLTVNAGDFAGERTYRCLVSGMYYDNMTLAHLADGSDAYTVLLTNEAHTVVCNSAGTPAAGELGVGGKAVTDVLVFKGATALTAVASGPGAGQFSLATADTNVTSAKVDHDTVRIDAMSADSGYVTITVNLEGLAAVTKRFTVVKAKAGVDAFADIDIPIPYTGTATKWEDCFSNNSPVAGSVAWTTFKVKYKASDNTVAAGNTAHGWLYWDAVAPSVVSSSATRPTLAAGQWLIGYNNGGTFEPSFFSKLITAGFLSVNVLSAIAADLGTITAGTITLDLGSNKRLRLSPAGLWGSADGGSSYYEIIGITVDGARITALSVDTGQLKDESVTGFDDAYTAAVVTLTTTSWVDLQTVSNFVSSGKRLTISAQADISVYNVTDATSYSEYRIVRGITELYSWTIAYGASPYQLGRRIVELPAAGTYTYKLQGACRADVATYNADVSGRYLGVEEMKK